MLIFTNQQCHIENGILKFPKIMDLEVETRLDDMDLREVRIIPSGVGYNVEIVYSKEITGISDLNPKRILGIDIGVRNIITIGNNISEKGIAVRGGVRKSINQYFNKELSRLKSVNDKVEKVIITYRDRLSRAAFDLFKNLFEKFGTEIVVISDIGSTKLDSEEIFEDIISMLHCYSMKMYSKRKKSSIEVGYEDNQD